MPSSLGGIIPRALGFSPCPPVSVCGTGTRASTLRGFSRQCGIGQFPSRRRVPIRSRGWGLTPEGTDLPIPSPYSLRPGRPTPGWPSLLRHPIAPPGWRRNVDRLPIGYAFRPRLRSRLTLGGRAFPRKPWAFGGRDSHPPYRYSRRHSHFPAVHCSSRCSFNPLGTLPYRLQKPKLLQTPGFGGWLKPR